MTGLRSAAPIYTAAMSELPDLHARYWKHGTLKSSPKDISQACNLNPLFAVPSVDQVLHYGTDPLLGFHLATAYASLAEEKASKQTNTNRQKGPDKAVAAAKAEFDAWTSSFRKNSARGFCIRFFAGDAIAFSFELRICRAGLGQDPAGWYRDRTHFEPIALGSDYAAGGSAPTTFDVIDTSNLVDHLGALNVMIAVAPLLKRDITATLYTERLLKLAATRKDLLDDLVDGHLPTLSTLLGLVSVEMVTNTSTVSAGDESIVDFSMAQFRDKSPDVGQQFVRLAWKRPISMCHSPLSQGTVQKVSFEAVELAQVLYAIYLNMFKAEDMADIMRDLDTRDLNAADKIVMNLHKRALPKYHRASFAGFLRFVKSRVNTDWDASMGELLELIESNTTHILSRNYLQELYVWLHILDVYTVDALIARPNRPVDSTSFEDLRCWGSIPPVVCLTLEVPRSRLTALTTGDKTLGTPPLCCSVASRPGHPRPYENSFAALQTGFGTISTTGTRFNGSFKVKVTEDKSTWSGKLPMVVSFYVPAWLLLLEPRKTVLAFGVQSTPSTANKYTSTLGLQLTLFETTLDDSRHVHISEEFPNMSTRVKMVSFAEDDDRPEFNTSSDSETILSAAVSHNARHITSLTNRINLHEELGRILGNGCEVKVKALSPLSYEVRLGKTNTIVVDFPVSVEQSNIKTRIARKSSYVELVAAIDALVPSMTSFAHPLLQTLNGAILWNLPYLNLDLQPPLDVTQPGPLQWLVPHTSMMFSARQRHLRENKTSPALASERTLVELKDSLFSLFMHYSGVQAEKTSLFGISCPTAGGVHIVLLVSHFRLDLSSRTVVLDAAAIPLYDELMPHIYESISTLTDMGLCQVYATEAEMGLWKLLLPAWAERCRSWSHKKGCEYVIAKRIPLSVAGGKRCLCSCGTGKFPANYLRGTPSLNGILKYAVRVAISPLFHSALVDDVYNGIKSSEPKSSVAKTLESKSSGACIRCGTQHSDLQLCSGCRLVQYCSRACQRVDWKSHKPICSNRK